jgi:carbon-monoxide dehydrogenase medium subunit
MWQNYHTATTVNDVLGVLADRGEKARVVAGATDLIIEIERGVRKGIDTLVDVTRIPGLGKIVMDEPGWIHLAPQVTHNDCVASKLIREYAFPLAQAAWEVGAPQIRNRGTVAGNLITASPANDTITPLMALGAQVTLRSLRGERVVPLEDFYTGVRGTVMEPDEMLVDIAFPGMQPDQRGMFIKLGLRRAQAIAIVNAAVLVTFSQGGISSASPRIDDVTITLGAVAPTIIHANNAETFLSGRELSDETISRAAELAMRDARPIDDVRSTAVYRKEMVRVCVSRCLHAILEGKEREDFPTATVLLAAQPQNGRDRTPGEMLRHDETTPIVTIINGRDYEFNSGQDKTLLRLLREEAGLIGTKEGCAEGECGACTVFLDGMAVMSCLVPAVRAHGAEITTIEGLALENELHPIQQAFIDGGAVQCGYCTPGFIMSGAMLLEEQPAPTKEQVQQAITGNLCRCTGYYKIVEAIEKAGQL